MKAKIDKKFLVSWIIPFESVAIKSPCYKENNFRRDSMC